MTSRKEIKESECSNSRDIMNQDEIPQELMNKIVMDYLISVGDENTIRAFEREAKISGEKKH